MLGKAAALLELADELMTSSVYDNVDNFAQAVGSGAAVAQQEELADQQERVAALETTISGAKLRYAAALVLHEAPGTGGGVCSGNGMNMSSGGGDDSDSVGSILLRKLNWLATPSSLKHAAPSNLPAASKERTQKQRNALRQKHGGGALSVCPIPPTFAPIPCKPVFYDVALNHLDLAGGDSEVARGVDRRSGLQVSVSRPRGRSQDQETSPGGSSSLVGAAAQSIYGWWSGGS